MKALSRNIRISPFKLRVYADSIRGKSVSTAVHWLEAQSLNRVVPIAKTLVSAYHNARQADSSIVDMAQMRIKDIRIDQGPVIRYFKPGAQGRACPQRKRLSHISVVVEKYKFKRCRVGQKVHPIGFRLGVFRKWNACWFAKKDYKKNIQEDFRIREFLGKRLEKAEIASMNIERAGDSIRVEVHSARPGLIIGKRGQEIESIRTDLTKEFGKSIDLSIQEVKVVEHSAQLVAKGIAEQIERRVGYKRLMKKAGHSVMKSGARGIKIRCAGRLAGSEIARAEWLRLGCVPLHTLRSDIDHALVEAKTTYGIIGVQVWICRGEF